MGESPIYKIGIGFSEQLVDELPKDDHDVKLDAVLTDRELIVSCTATRFAY
jgi:5-formyltetrahydrofolate cyclo-ligase